jgi:autotransporter passenger strand-loop-strand repeat protein
VLSGGVAIGDTVFAGSQVVSSGGTISNAIIKGGTVALETGAVVGGGIAFAGAGTLDIFDTTMPTGTISGFVAGDTIDLVSIASSSAAPRL